MRLFFGIGLPENLRARVAQVQSLLRRDLRDVRWIPPENLHITLRFLGDTADDSVAGLCRAADTACAAAARFSLRLRGAGAFPAGRRARALWVGVEEIDGGLASLVEQLDAALLPGVGARARPYRPHLTLGRPRRGFRGDLAAALEELKDLDLGMVDVDRVHLYESQLSQQGARYAVINSFRLQPRRSS